MDRTNSPSSRTSRRSVTPPPPTAPPQAPGFAEAFRYWATLGCISFGGPAGQIALMHAELVDKRRWISERRFLHALNYCMLLPGPEATQLAIYIGWLLHRTRGGIVAGVMFVLPSLVLLIGLSWLYLVYGTLPAVAGILYGVKPAVVAIVLAAAWRIGSRSLKNRYLVAIAVLAFVAIAVFDVPFPAIVLVAGLLGAAGGIWLPDSFDLGGGHAAKAVAHLPALIDDDTPTPAHARFTLKRIVAVLASGIGIGLAVWLLLAWSTGLHGTLARLGGFFSKAALLTFGGAYAVLPYVYQGAVDGYGWLTPAQMMDGLALGETTPGPLIIIVAFVGFVGGWGAGGIGTVAAAKAGTAAALGMGALTGGTLTGGAALGGPGYAVAGACVAAFFTFLPSFVLILAGGPLVESTRGNLRLTSPLTAISAAVVGVVVSLALFFAVHVFRWSQPLARWDWLAMAIAAAAALALLRLKIGTVPVLLACATAGLVVSYLMNL